MALCEGCILKWLPDALRAGRMKWASLHPRVQLILRKHGYDMNGRKPEVPNTPFAASIAAAPRK